MKKLTVFMALLFASVTLSANDDFGFRFGLKASPNLSWFRTETSYYSNDGINLGFSYGLIVDYKLTDNYAIGTGVNILRTGGKLNYRIIYNYEGQQIDTDKRREHYLRYLEIPLTMKLSTSEMGFITYYGQFGLGLGANLRARADDRVYLSEGSTLRTTDVDISDEIRCLRAGLIIGAGLEYNMGGRTSLLGGITFNNGFSNVLKKDNPFNPQAPDPSAMNNYVEITLGIMF